MHATMQYRCYYMHCDTYSSRDNAHACRVPVDVADVWAALSSCEHSSACTGHVGTWACCVSDSVTDVFTCRVSGGLAAVLQGGANRRRRLQRLPEESALLHAWRRCHGQPPIACPAPRRQQLALLSQYRGKYTARAYARANCVDLVLLVCCGSWLVQST